MSTKKAIRRPSASALEDQLGGHALAIISFLYNRVVAGAAAALRKRIGLSVTEARMVFQIGAAGATSANELSRFLGLDKAAISRATSRLIDLGLVVSERDPHHAARNILTLTETGQLSYRAIEQFTFARESHLLSVLGDDEQQQFLASLRKILTNVDTVNKLVAQGHFWD